VGLRKSFGVVDFDGVPQENQDLFVQKFSYNFQDIYFFNRIEVSIFEILIHYHE
jgi:hypothetical protein